MDNLEEFASICIRETRCTEIAFPTLTPVVGVPGEDLLGAIELLEQHAAGEQMRPCHRSERHDCMGATKDRGVEPIHAADGEGKLRAALITPGGNTIGQSAAGPSATALVEGNKRSAGRQCAEDQLALACFQHRRREPASLRELDDHRRR